MKKNKKVPIMCRVFKIIMRGSPSAVFQGCDIGRRPNIACKWCKYYSDPFVEYWIEQNMKMAEAFNKGMLDGFTKDFGEELAINDDTEGMK